jgi:glycosyltransferase involved in cell wall biosynthesis
MKVFLENLKPNMNPYNGKGKFIDRLANELKKQGVEIVDNPKVCDINLCMNSLPKYDYGIKVTRLDDVAFSNDIIHKNIYRKGLRKTQFAIKTADAIIYQSKVAKNTNEGILNIKAKKDTIIYNGTNPQKHKQEFIKLPVGKNFIHASQILFPQRRVDILLECWGEFIQDKDDVYLHLVHDRNEDFENIDLTKHKNVLYHDIMVQEDLDRFVYSCDAAISIKYQDSCPNFIIESIAVGTPVITTNTNGLAEILNEPQVIVANVDPYYTHEKVEWERPPFENKEELIKALENIYQNPKRKFDFPDEIHIKTTARNYIEFFETLLAENQNVKKNPIKSFINTYFVNKIKKKMGHM